MRGEDLEMSLLREMGEHKSRSCSFVAQGNEASMGRDFPGRDKPMRG